MIAYFALVLLLLLPIMIVSKVYVPIKVLITFR